MKLKPEQDQEREEIMMSMSLSELGAQMMSNQSHNMFSHD